MKPGRFSYPKDVDEIGCEKCGPNGRYGMPQFLNTAESFGHDLSPSRRPSRLKSVSCDSTVDILCASSNYALMLRCDILVSPDALVMTEYCKLLSLPNSNLGEIDLFKFIVSAAIALVGAGAGIVALLDYNERQKTQKNKDWENFSPVAISGGTQTAELRGGDFFDLETGRITSNSSGMSSTFDLRFICGAQAMEGLRALNSATWANLGVIGIPQVKYRKIRDANFINVTHPTSGNSDLYYAHKSNAPPSGTSYSVRTSEGNVAIIRIEKYLNQPSDPNICRDVLLEYVVYPSVKDPVRP